MKKKVLVDQLNQDYPNQTWLNNWTSRDGKNGRGQKQKDEQLWFACWDGRWEDAMKLINGGATGDYVRENTGTIAYTFADIAGQTQITNLLCRTFPGEDEKNTAILSVYHKRWTVDGMKILLPKYGSAEWFIDWQARDEAKTDPQRYLDAKLYFACTETQRWGLLLDVVIKLLEEGATCDYINESGSCAIHEAIWNSTPNLLHSVLSYWPRDADRKTTFDESPWDMSLRSKKREASNQIVEYAPHPFHRLISCRDYDQAQLSTEYITNHGQLADVVTIDLQYVKEKGLMADLTVRANMLKLLGTLEKEYDLDVKLVIKDGLGSKYFESEPLVWHYKTTRGKAQFVAAYFKKNQITDRVMLRIDGDQVKVRFALQ